MSNNENVINDESSVDLKVYESIDIENCFYQEMPIDDISKLYSPTDIGLIESENMKSSGILGEEVKVENEKYRLTKIIKNIPHGIEFKIRNRKIDDDYFSVKDNKMKNDVVLAVYSLQKEMIKQFDGVLAPYTVNGYEEWLNGSQYIFDSLFHAVSSVYVDQNGSEYLVNLTETKLSYDGKKAYENMLNKAREPISFYCNNVGQAYLILRPY